MEPMTIDDDLRDMSTTDSSPSETEVKTASRKRKYSTKEEFRESERARKRKQRKNAKPEQRSQERERRKKKKWRKQQYVDLLNDMKHEARARTYLGSQSRTSRFTSGELQNGLTAWSDKERHIFAEELARNNLSHIETFEDLLSSKSPFEILAFQHMMMHASAKHDVHGRSVDLLRPENVPAASEISAECCDALDMAADHICKLEWRDDCGHEKARYGAHYLLTVDDAQHFEDRLADNRPDIGVGTVPPEQDDLDAKPGAINAAVTTAMNLLDLKMLLHLSRTLYAVTAREEGISERDASNDENSCNGQPSIFASALIDFENLVRSVTRRLIGASIYQANTRLRANDHRDDRTSKLRVRSKDVIAAAEILHMPRNSLDYWQDAPRRLNLKVYKTVMDGKVRRNRFLTTDEFLNLPRHKRSRKNKAEGEGSESESESEENLVSTSGETGSCDEATAEMDEEEEAFDEVDHYITKHDQKVSAREEQRLWKMMRQSCPPAIANALEEEPSPAPKMTRKDPEDLADWRSRCDYQSPWERYGQAYTDEVLPALDANGGLFRGAIYNRRDLASDASDLSSGDISDAEAEEGARDTDDQTVSNSEATSGPDIEATSDDEIMSNSIVSSTRGRSKRRSSSVTSYAYEVVDGVPRPEDLPSDSEDDFQPPRRVRSR